MDDNKMQEETPESISSGPSRRNFIKGVIAAGAAASSSAYLFRSATLHGQPAAGRRRASRHAERERPGSPRRSDAAGTRWR
jgi:hypothetical protein